MEEKFVAKNLDEAVDHLISNLVLTDENIKFLEKYKDDERGFVGQIHHFYGMNLRNDWGLWWQKDWVEKYGTEKPPLVQWFNDHEIYHADDMSGIITTTLHRKYFNQPINLEQQIAVYHKHWLKYVGKKNPMEATDE